MFYQTAVQHHMSECSIKQQYNITCLNVLSNSST